MSDEKNEKRNLQKKTFLKSLEQGTSIIKACKSADIAVVTAWRWRRDNKDFDEKVLAIIESRTQVVEDALYVGASKGNVIAQIFWLKNRAKDRWKDKQEYEHSGVIGYKLLNVDISKYPKAKNAVSVPTKDNSSEKGD